MKKLVDPKLLFSVKGDAENYNHQKEENKFINWLADKIFQPDFMDIYKKNENIINSYDDEVQNILLDKIFTFRNLDLEKGEQTDILLKNIYDLYLYNDLIRFNYIPSDVLALNLELLSALEENIDSNLYKNGKFAAFMDLLKMKYTWAAFGQKDYYCIDKVFQFVRPEMYLGVLASYTKYPVVEDGNLAAREVPMLWAVLSNRFYTSPFSAQYENIRSILLDIDSYKNKLKEQLPKESQTIDALFCDELKAYILLVCYEHDNNSQTETIELLEKGYGEVFEKVNGYSFYDYVKSQTEIKEDMSDYEKDYSQYHLQPKFEALNTYYNNLNLNMNL